MGLKLKPKDLKKAYKVARKIAPDALIVTEAIFPNSKLVRNAAKAVRKFL